MILKGFISAVIGGLGIVIRGASNGSKGMADASFHPSSFNNAIGVGLSILFWGGIAVIAYGLILRFFSKSD